MGNGSATTEDNASIAHLDLMQIDNNDDAVLFPDQQRALDIIHNQIEIQKRCPSAPPLRMLVVGEGGTGKSELIKRATKLLQSSLSISAFTGIAASKVGGSTTHREWGIRVRRNRDNSDGMGAESKRRLVDKFKFKNWAFFDEISMISAKFFFTIARHADIAKAGTYNSQEGTWDFYQFPPVTGRALYNTTGNMTEDEHAGRAIFEQFNRVVILRDQVRIQDAPWLDTLRAARHGACNAHIHLPMIRSLILENNALDRPNFATPPWNHAVLITSRHALRTSWNERSLRSHCQQTQVPLIISTAEDVMKRRGMESRSLTHHEQAVAYSKDPKTRKLPDTVELAVGMPCMVTMNVKTEQDLANGTRGTLVDIILDSREQEINQEASIHTLQYPPRYILFKPDETRAGNLTGLPEGVFPIEPITCKYTIDVQGKTTSVERRQIPVTGGYAFTDYRSQGQTLPAVIVDLAKPPSGTLTPFGAYVALSRSRGRDTIRLLRDFEDRIFTTHPSESLRNENLRLEEQDQLTREWWRHKVGVQYKIFNLQPLIAWPQKQQAEGEGVRWQL